jgi:hypothetical protein
MKKQVFRLILMISGVLTVAVILLSQSLYFPGEKDHALRKADTSTEQAPGTTIIQAPADVVPSPSVQLDEVAPTALKKVPVPAEAHGKRTFPVSRILSSYFINLFRAIISPNAP